MVSTSLIIREMQTKDTVLYHRLLVRPGIKKQKQKRKWKLQALLRRLGKGLLYTTGGCVNGYSHYGKYSRVPKEIKCGPAKWPSHPHPGIHSQEVGSVSCAPVFMTAPRTNRADMESAQTSPNT